MHHSQLLEIADQKDAGMNHVRIVANGLGGRVCSSCGELGEKVFTLASELDIQTLPNKLYTCSAHGDDLEGFCLCYYEPVFDDEL